MTSDAEQIPTGDGGVAVPGEAPVSMAGGRRRRLLGAAAGGVGVFLAVQARSALGQNLVQSPSAMMSGNTSPGQGNPTPLSGGFSPGFWKQPQHFSEWSNAGAVPPTFKQAVSECKNGQKGLSAANIVSPGTLVSVVFPGAPAGPDVGLWEVLASPKDFGAAGQLMRHLSAAWLNAGAVPNYPMTQAQVRDMWSQLATGGVYCPPGIDCHGGGMTPDEVVNYIEGMYDINASFDNEPCDSDDGNGKGKKT